MWTEHGIYQTSGLAKRYPLSMFQTRQGSTTARMGDGQAGYTGQGWTLAEARAAVAPTLAQTHIAHQQSRSQPYAALGTGRQKNPRKTLKINSGSKTLTIDQGKSETRKCFIGKVQKNQSLQLNLQQ